MLLVGGTNAIIVDWLTDASRPTGGMLDELADAFLALLERPWSSAQRSSPPAVVEVLARVGS